MALKGLTYGAALVGLGAALTGYAATKRTATIEAAYPPLGQFTQVDGARVHYVQRGRGPHVVLLHGAGGNLRDFTFALMDLLTSDYTVTAFDRPGFGYTDRLPQVDAGPFTTAAESPAEQADMLRKAAAAIGITDPIVVGHSFGGIVAMAWAAGGIGTDNAQNARAVVSLAGVMMPWPGDLGAYYTVNGSSVGGAVLVPLISALAPDSTINNTVAAVFKPQSPPDGFVAYYGGALAVRPATFRANVRQVNTLRPHVVELSKRYPELDLPVEVLHGTADTTVPINIHPQEARKIIRKLNLTALDGVGHMPHHSDPDAFVAAIHRAARRAGLR